MASTSGTGRNTIAHDTAPHGGSASTNRGAPANPPAQTCSDDSESSLDYEIVRSNRRLAISERNANRNAAERHSKYTGTIPKRAMRTPSTMVRVNYAPSTSSPNDHRNRSERYSHHELMMNQSDEDMLDGQIDTTVEQANRNCTAVLGLIRKLHNRLIVEVGTKDMTSTMVKMYTSVVDRHWNAYFDSHMHRICALPHDQAANLDSELFQAEEMYDQIGVALATRLRKLKHEQLDRSITASEHRPPNDIAIGHIKIEMFDGELRKWSHFKDIYNQLVHQKDYDVMRKLSYLIDHLTPGSEPYEIVYGFEKSPEGYEAAWRALCDTFDNEHRLVMNIVGRFIDIPPISENPTRVDLMTLVNKTNQLILALPRYKVSVESWDVIIIALLIRKMDKRSQAKWLASNMSHQLPKLSTMLEFLKARAVSLQEQEAKPTATSVLVPQIGHQSQSQSNRPQNKSSNGKQHKSVTPKQNPPKSAEAKAAEAAAEKCPLCKQLGHRLFMCPEFTSKSFNDRIAMARQIGVCNRCLRLTCAPSRCTMGPCSCGELHNRALCQIHADKLQQRKAAVLGASTASESQPRQPV